MKFLWFMLFLVTLSLLTKEIDNQTGLLKEVKIGMNKHGMFYINFRNDYYVF